MADNFVRPFDSRKRPLNRKRICTEKSLPAQPGAPPTAGTRLAPGFWNPFVYARGVPGSGGEICPASSAADLPFFPLFPLVWNLPHHTAPSTPAPRLLVINSYPSLTYCHWGAESDRLASFVGFQWLALSTKKLVAT